MTPDIFECERIDHGSLEPMRSVAKIVAVTLEIIFTLLAIASVLNVARSGQWTVSTSSASSFKAYRFKPVQVSCRNLKGHCGTN